MTATSGAAFGSAFVELEASDELRGRVGCLFALSVPLLFIGCGLVVVSFLPGGGEGSAWVMPAVGGAFALVGALTLFAGLRGARGLKLPRPRVAIEQGVPLRSGASVRVRLQQPGPIGIESLKLKARCERVYQRRVKEGSSSTVEDRELIWEQDLLDVRNERVPAGLALEREATLTLPAEIQPTGPAGAGGRICWQVQVWGEVGWLRATYHAFEIRVHPSTRGAAPPDSAASPETAADSRSRHHDRDGGGAAARRKGSGPPPRGGCLFIGVGFLAAGAFFLWMFFSGSAFSGRGNPYMALFGGLLFAAVGLVALTAVVLSVLPSPRSARRGARREH